jgi:hypothetical protein
MLDAAMQDCGWALRYARCLHARLVPSWALREGLKTGIVMRLVTFIGVSGRPAVLGEGESASPATAHKHCQADAPKTGIAFAGGGALRYDGWSGFGFGVFLLLLF